MKILFWKRIFVDKNGEYTGFNWWIRWVIAFWHLRKWLEYEGMPKGTKNFDIVMEWEKRVAMTEDIEKTCFNISAGAYKDLTEVLLAFRKDEMGLHEARHYIATSFEIEIKKNFNAKNKPSRSFLLCDNCCLGTFSSQKDEALP